MIISEMQHKLATWAQSDPIRRFDRLLRLIADQVWLAEAARVVLASSGAHTPGIDGMELADICVFTMRSGRIRAWGPERPTKPILTICPRPWQHDFGSGGGHHSSRATRFFHEAHHRHMKTTTRRRSTYPWPIAVQADRATSVRGGQCPPSLSGIEPAYATPR